jgi:hypothetical protein
MRECSYLKKKKKINTYPHVKNTYTIRTNDDQNIVNDWQQKFASTFVKLTWQNCLSYLIPYSPLSLTLDNLKFCNGRELRDNEIHLYIQLFNKSANSSSI